MRLQRLLHPRSIAFVGGSECAIAIERSRALGFDGRIWAVNPRRPQLGGVPTVATVADIDGSPDAAFIALPRALTPDAVAALRAKGCGGAVIYAAGFAETGDRGRQDALLAAADGMPLLGPNCYGFINTTSRAALWPDEHALAPVERGVALVTQSGNIGCNLTMMRRGLPVAALLTLGNQADIDIAAAVDAFAADPQISAIGLHIEGLRDPQAFAAAAARAQAAGKPVVALKTGRSPQGARIAMSHTASLAGEDRICEALFERYGVARVPTLSALVETLKLLHFGGPTTGRRLVSLSCSGGEAALVADLAPAYGLSFPPFSEDAARGVAATLNDLVHIDNPLDYHTFIWNQSEALEATFTASMAGGFDVAMLILDTPTHPAMKPDSWLVTARAWIAAQRRVGARAVVVATLAEGMPEGLAAELGAAGVAPLIGIEDALAAFAAAAAIGERHAAPVAALPWPPAADAAGGGATAPESLAAPRFLRESEAKRLLAAEGLVVPAAAECALGEAPQVAARIGFPVVLKIADERIAHKSDVGGVALGLRTTDEVAAAAARMAPLGDRVLVEQMVGGAVAEFIVGVVRDPQYGLALLIGAGGVLAELIEDSVTLLLPATRGDIERAVKRLRVWTLVEGHRGRDGDPESVLRAIEAVARFAEANRHRLLELDVNPLLALPDRAVAVDALIKLKTE